MEQEGRVKRGFTLAELLFAVGLLVLVVLTILAISLSTIRTNQKADLLDHASQVADRLIKETIYGIENDLPAGMTAGFWAASGQWVAPTPLTVGGVDYEYSISVSPVGSFLAPNRLKKVDLQLWWWDSRSQGGEREGYGRMELHTSRVVHEVAP